WLRVATAFTVRSVNSICGPNGGIHPFAALSAMSIWLSCGTSSTFSLPSLLDSTALSIAPSCVSCKSASNGDTFAAWESSLIALTTTCPICKVLSATEASSHLGRRDNTSSATVADCTSTLRIVLTSENTDPNSDDSNILSILTSWVVPTLTFCRMISNPLRIDTCIEPIDTGSFTCSDASLSIEG